jgi:hypothetical protein
MAIRYDALEGFKTDILYVCDCCFDHVKKESDKKDSYVSTLPECWSEYVVTCSYKYMKKNASYSETASRAVQYHFCGKCVDNIPELTFKRAKNTWVKE